MSDAGPGLEYNFLFFNLNEPGEKTSPDLARKMKWFREVKFRQAVSAAIDRDALVRLVYQGRGAALWGPVTPGNRRWGHPAIPHPARSLEKARALLKEAGFIWTAGPNGESELVDSDAKPVEFSILTSSSNADRTKMATLIEQQLAAPRYEQRKKYFDRVQEILAENQPMIFLASPDILAGAKNSLGNFHPAVLEPYVLWNAEQLYFRNPAENAR